MGRDTSGNSNVHLGRKAKSDYLNLAGGANIDVVKIKHIPQLFYSFAYADDRVSSPVKWGETNILLLNASTPHITDFIDNQPRPYNKVKLATKNPRTCYDNRRKNYGRHK